MIKKNIAIVFGILLFLAVLPTGLAAPSIWDAEESQASSPEFRGLWVATVLNLDYPSRQGLSSEALKTEALTILDKAQTLGFNAIILQVRPAGDALYKSDIYPWSLYLTGTQGLAPDSDFDPLAFWIDEAHKRGLELHAWVNPLRVTRNSGSVQYGLAQLAPTNPARLNPDWAISHKDGNLYLDPGIPAVRDLVVRGVVEIVQRYKVDGIHFDDYFYPGTDFPDDVSYAQYGGSAHRADWRRANVNALISATRTAIKNTGSTTRFGVSPFAIWLNASSSDLGSPTNGLESYNAHYADTRAWVKNGWIDYICPQIYWEIGYKIADYSQLLQWWVDVVKDTPVDLYIGQAAYRAGEGKKVTDPWYGTAEITRQLTLNDQYPEVKGHIMFRYKFFADNIYLSLAVKNYHEDPIFTPANPYLVMPSFTPADPASFLRVGRPAQNITTSQKNYYLLGASDPSKPLKVNGQEITNRTSEGYFAVYLSLQLGANSYAFTQEGQKTVTRTITRSTGGGGGGGGSPAKIEPTPSGKLIYAEVKNPTVFVFPGATTTGGPSGELTQGQVDLVTAQTSDGKWFQLGVGVWVQAADIVRSEGKEPLVTVLSAPVYAVGDRWDTITWPVSRSTATTVAYDGQTLTLKIQAVKSSPPELSLPEAGLFTQVSATTEGNRAVYSLSLRPGQRIEGYYTTTTSDSLTLHIRKTPQITDPAQPLKDIVILVDPGHGGTESGALGPLGAVFPEKTINLYASQKVKAELERLGATVHMTRDGDTFVSLNDRVEQSRALRPDLFISIHGNSLDEVTNADTIYGLSIWYKETTAKSFSDFLYGYLWNDLNRSQRGSHQANLYVCRPTWAPSFLIETGFLCNPQEFAWLIDDNQQNRLAHSIAKGVAAYYLQ